MLEYFSSSRSYVPRFFSPWLRAGVYVSSSRETRSSVTAIAIISALPQCCGYTQCVERVLRARLLSRLICAFKTVWYYFTRVGRSFLRTAAASLESASWSLRPMDQRIKYAASRYKLCSQYCDTASD